MKKCFLLLIVFLISSCSAADWRTASRKSANMAPKLKELKEDIVLIYYARLFADKGYFGVHPWVAWKKKEEKNYLVTEITSWHLRKNGKTAISQRYDIPDRHWYGSKPTLLFEAKGKEARKIINQLEVLIKDYPFKGTYHLWPGPNSNTFISYLIRHVRELNIELTPLSVGKDFVHLDKFITTAPAGLGFQVSLFGLLGFTLGVNDGIELNLLGMTFGLDILRPALKLPIIGRLGFPDAGT